MFVHFAPHETRTIRRIPRALRFPAPGRPKGHLVMVHNERGECPMRIGGECSIYEDRPLTCRDYDCRMFTATGIAVDAAGQPEIAQRVGEWEFRYETAEAAGEHAMLRRAAAFLQDQRDSFPVASLPNQPGPLAALVVRVWRRGGSGGCGDCGGDREGSVQSAPPARRLASTRPL